MGETNAYHFSLQNVTSFPSLSEDDKNILEIVINRLGKMTKDEIVNFMHKEQAYAETAQRDAIPFSYAEHLQI